MLLSVLKKKKNRYL